MNSKDKVLIKLLHEEIELLDKASHWLNRSILQSKDINLDAELINENEFDVLDNLSTRYMRFYEVLINQVLRTLLELLGESELTKIDTFHKAEKLGFCKNATDLNECRIIRNKIAHEYAKEEWLPIYKEVFYGIEILINTAGNIKNEIHQRGF